MEQPPHTWRTQRTLIRIKMMCSSIHSEEAHLGTVLAVLEYYTLTHTTYSFKP